MNGSLRAFGLDLEKQMNGWWTLYSRDVGAWSRRTADEFINVVDLKGRRGLILGWMGDEHFLQGSSGLDLELMELLQGLLGLILKNGGWIYWCCWSKGPSRLDLRMNGWWTMNTFFKGRRGLILNWWKFFKGHWCGCKFSPSSSWTKLHLQNN